MGRKLIGNFLCLDGEFVECGRNSLNPGDLAFTCQLKQALCTKSARANHASSARERHQKEIDKSTNMKLLPHAEASVGGREQQRFAYVRRRGQHIAVRERHLLRAPRRA